MGAVTPYGRGVEALWEGLVAGRDALRPIERFDTSEYRVRLGGIVAESAIREFDFPEDPSIAKMDLGLRFCAQAVREAIQSAGLTRDDIAAGEAALVLATNFGPQGLAPWRRFAVGACPDVAAGTVPQRMKQGDSPLALRESLLEFAPAFIADLWGVGGPRAMITLSCASGNAALGYATDLLRAGRAKTAIVCGYDVISEYAWSGLLALRTMTTDKVRPFDKNRSGTIFGEGAGAMVLEAKSHARTRALEPRVELAGHHTNNNAFHLTAPDKDGASIVRAMMRALEDARVAPSEVDHVNAHATATKYNDKAETAAIKAVLGKRAGEIPVNGIKSMIGHLMGAASIVETIAAARTVETGVVPPTINFETPDPECDLHYCTSGAEKHDVRCAVSNSSGLGGCNSVVVLRRVP
jgi:3-oxoacyl-(acyl-carrier-protein) synthase